MPLKALRPCRHVGCAALTREGYCDRHKRDSKARRASAEWHWMYGTPIWKADLRRAQLLREPFCRECAKLGERVQATVVDHKQPHRGVWSAFIDRENLQSLCKRHHDAKTMRELVLSRKER